MQLCKFLNTVAFLFLTDKDFQETSNLAGINWNELPEFECVMVIREYLSRIATEPHKVAVSSVQDGLRFIEKSGIDFSIVGKSEEELAFNFNKNLKAHKYQTLAERILKDPFNAESIINSFDISSSKQISIKTVSEFLPEKYDSFLLKQKEGKERTVIPNFEHLSKMIGGFNKGRVIMILGETGFGKTNFSMNILVNAATKFKCLFINMEMPLEDISNRLAVLTSGKSFKDLYSGNILKTEITEYLPAYGDNIKFTEGFSLSVQSIESLMRREKKTGLDFVVIDYDQKIELVYSKGMPEWKLLQIAIQHIENLAKELDVCVLLMAQVNRDGVVSSSHRATFTAHTILNFKSKDINTVFDSKANALIHAEKNRHGKKDQALLVNYNNENLRIKEIAVVDYQKQDKAGPRARSI